MHRDLQENLQNLRWSAVCALDQILPDTGVCALVNDTQVAVFRVGAGAERVFAIANVDPKSGAAVLSRGLVGSLGERLVVASPIYKQHFDLRTGECIEIPEQPVASYPVRIDAGQVWVGA
ncbi:MAG TPA: nitrite reductase small subunit NirD [Janthinobacterium sp.]|jgi:nitrite reductase (NADH) small subunit|nr:nitrite reductase small subunit NirD [Janthinobacterium sp.]